MTPTRAAIIGAAIIGGAWMLARAADQAAAYDVQDAPSADPAEGSTVLDFANPWGAIERQYDAHQTEAAMSSTNTAAFLTLIDYSEGTSKGGRDPYRTCYGYRHTINSFADHPAVTGEWSGESIANLGPQYAGQVSTAAGRYQIIKPTWLMCKRALNLPDFSPDSQDKAAVYLIRKRGALDAIEAGRVAEAVAKCRQEWASLPGAGYGQPERRLTALIDAYTNAGGVLA
ncbi:glycoside hydrolase family 104 protein [Paucibacter sp. TC2R-5]|uniref:glycoside hydrolase family 24 protein n=1 Tax=Paucibacter sp. TC2R-5 TaxID=2893555 RepID=UPI0021E4CC39|nr:glycoside hydrolase family 104 protein [Paucibacter sp. TC2R-5]MCV2361657.1 glycoside hydrolase family 104 protein [Paucibacter sp. TC2R-5]